MQPRPHPCLRLIRAHLEHTTGRLDPGRDAPSRDECARQGGGLRRLRRPEAAHLALGERTEALAAAREGIDRGRDAGPRYSEASVQIALAQILLSADGDLPRVKIEAALDRTEELVASVEGHLLSPRILELRGRLAAALGDTPAADRVLRRRSPSTEPSAPPVTPIVRNGISRVVASNARSALRTADGRCSHEKC